MRAGVAAGKHRAVGGFNRNDLHLRLAGFQNLTGAGDRAARADAGNENVDRPVGIVPDFFCRRLAVNIRIGGVFELLRYDGVGQRRSQFLRLGDCALHALRAFGQHQFGTEQGEHFAAFDRHGFRHGQDQLVALGGGSKGERDAGIAGGRLHQRCLAGGDLALRFQRFDHGNTDAVLHGGNGVEKFQLGEQVGLDALFFRQLVQPHDRRIADCFRNRGIDASASGLSGFGHDALLYEGHRIVTARFERQNRSNRPVRLANVHPYMAGLPEKFHDKPGKCTKLF